MLLDLPSFGAVPPLLQHARLYWAGSWLEGIYGLVNSGLLSSAVFRELRESRGAASGSLRLIRPRQRCRDSYTCTFRIPLPVAANSRMVHLRCRWAMVVLYVILDGLGGAGWSRWNRLYLSSRRRVQCGLLPNRYSIHAPVRAISARRAPRAAPAATDSTSGTGADPRTCRSSRRKRAKAERSARRSRREGRCSSG